jgi:hypothetical protein
MPADEEWEEWIDRFVTKIVQILGSEYPKCKLERVVKATQKRKNELIHAAIVSDLKCGSRTYVNTVEVQKKPLKDNSIGRLNEAFCSNLLDH